MYNNNSEKRGKIWKTWKYLVLSRYSCFTSFTCSPHLLHQFSFHSSQYVHTIDSYSYIYLPHNKMFSLFLKHQCSSQTLNVVQQLQTYIMYESWIYVYAIYVHVHTFMYVQQPRKEENNYSTSHFFVFLSSHLNSSSYHIILSFL